MQLPQCASIKTPVQLSPPPVSILQSSSPHYDDMAGTKHQGLAA